MPITPYLFFDGRCEEAVEFYRKALGAEVEMMMRFRECPETPDPASCGGGEQPGFGPEAGEKIMHASLRIGDGVVMASDGNCQGKPSFQGFSLSLTAANEAEADRLFGALAQGGEVQMPLGKTFFAPRFGMVADRFGVSWMVIVEPRP